MNSSADSRHKRRNRRRGRAVDPVALEEVRTVLGDAPRRRDLLIEHLHAVQDRFGHLAARHLVALAEEMRLAPTEVYEVASFYHHFDIVEEGDAPPPTLTVRVCDSVSCTLRGAEQLVQELQQDPPGNVRVQRVPCVGRCDQAPVAVVGRNPVDQATAGIVRMAVAAGRTEPELPSYVDYERYRAGGGYELLRECVQGARDPESVIRTLEDSALRGLGGAGFPAGRKWRIVRDQPGPRLLAANVDEGEPGTFKDRYYLERDPHRFLEGALIAAQVVGIAELYIYVRDEYAACRTLLALELERLRADPPCPLPPIHLRRGAGAYICGEESAMIESIEGKRGVPRLRPPYVAQVGLFGRPTLEHNLETLYWVRDIVSRGAQWFAAQGRRGHNGLRSFSVSGRVARPGVHVAPAGISLRELINEHCGGMQPGHELYAYFPGGASGGILPASKADLPLDFGTLEEHGCFIGSAAIMVLSRQDSARAAALNAMRFFAHESCGKCTPCRVGPVRGVEVIDRIRRREDPERNIALLRDLCDTMVDGSLCAMGGMTPFPVRSALEHFPEDFPGLGKE